MAGPNEASPKTLRLLRHAKSSWADPGLEDHERPLSGRGIRAARSIAHHLGAQRASIQLVLCSSAIRTQQTLDHIVGSIGSPEVRIDPGIYHADAGDLAAMLHDLGDDTDSVLMIGHNPAMQMLAGYLVGDGEAEAVERLRERFPTAGLATMTIPVQWAELRDGCAYLRSFVLPRELERS